jgi:predicted dehydrogenase
MHRRNFLQLSALTALAPAAQAATTAKRKVKIGQIGTGHAHAGGKMDGLRRLNDEFEVVGIVESDPERRRLAERQGVYRGLRWLTEEQLLNTPGLEAVVVETVVKDLVPTAAKCIAAGLHIHLDKPAGESLPAFKAVLDDATRRGRCVQMGFMFRHNPAFRLCFQAVREGWLGEVFELHGVIASGYKPPQRQPLLPYRGGTMFELGCHLIDAAVTVLGKPQRVTGYARRVHPEWDALADNQLAVLEYAKATATIRSSLVEVQAGRRRQFVVCGTEGTIDIRPLEPPAVEVTLSTPRGPFVKGTQQVPMPKMSGRYDDHLRELARIVRGEKQPEYGPEHDLAVHEAVLRAAGLARDGRGG